MVYSRINLFNHGCHPVAGEDSNGDAYLEQSKPESFFLPSELVDPNWVINQEKNLANSRQVPTNISQNLVFAKDKENERSF